MVGDVGRRWPPPAAHDTGGTPPRGCAGPMMLIMMLLYAPVHLVRWVAAKIRQALGRGDGKVPF